MEIYDGMRRIRVAEITMEEGAMYASLNLHALYEYANKALNNGQIVNAFGTVCEQKSAESTAKPWCFSTLAINAALIALLFAVSAKRERALPFVARFVVLFDPQSNLHIDIALYIVLIVEPGTLRLLAQSRSCFWFHFPFASSSLLLSFCLRVSSYFIYLSFFAWCYNYNQSARMSLRLTRIWCLRHISCIFAQL